MNTSKAAAHSCPLRGLAAAVMIAISIVSFGCGRASNEKESGNRQDAASPLSSSSPERVPNNAGEPVAAKVAVDAAPLSDTFPDDTATETDAAGDDAAGDDALGEIVEVGDVELDSLSERLDAAVNVEADVPSPTPSETDRSRLPAYRIWVPTSVGPLLVGIDVMVEGDPLKAVRDRYLTRLRGEIEKESGEDFRWEELISYVSDRPDQFGATSSDLERQSKQIVKRYDRDLNGRVDPEELTRFLFRDARISSEFRVFGTDAFRWSNRAAAPIFAAIDSNGDRVIDKVEQRQSDLAILRMIDQNADECISIDEIEAETDDGPWQMRRSDRDGSVAMDLDGYVSWNNLAFAMEGFLGQEPALAQANPLNPLDVDDDGRLSVGEARQVIESPTEIHLIAGFDPAGRQHAMDVRLPKERADLKIDRVGSRMVCLTGRRMNLLVSIHDDPVRQNRLPREVFDRIDANNDGAIDQDELPDAAATQIRFEELDVDESGTLTFDEINAAVDRPESVWKTQVRCRCAEFPDAVFAWLDTDHDQFLSTREIRSAPRRLESLGAERGVVNPADFPETVLIQLTRGEPNRDAARFRLSRTERDVKATMPEWARAMDANDDAEIASSEFFGPIESFESFDKDGNGFLDRSEVDLIE